MAMFSRALKRPGSIPWPPIQISSLPSGVKYLYAVLHAVGDPDVSVGIDGNAFRPCEIANAVAGLAELANEVAVGIEDLDPVVEGVGDVEIAVLVHGDADWLGEITRSG